VQDDFLANTLLFDSAMLRMRNYPRIPKRKELSMAKWLVIIESNCADPAREDEFNEWYNKTHLPDVLETPGAVRAVRYERTAPSEGKGKYLAIYEVEADDLQTWRGRTGRMSDLLQVTAKSSFKQIYSLSM